ncbi:hypothetical protein [Sphaerisporangium corydalis]|uniref:Tetratricopeptide repeat protein n=1 Tax=Sphaerisporangium corydalis TaxID=1441875 RepID=A0ABV9EGA8_9ACTN|nr:hypothetical protein [Sphaerisporangium corydalis]
MLAREKRLRAIGAAGAAVLSHVPYHQARTEQVAAEVRLTDVRRDDGAPAGGRSAVWLYNEVKSRRVLVALAALHAFELHLEAAGHPTGTSPAPTPSTRGPSADASPTITSPTVTSSTDASPMVTSPTGWPFMIGPSAGSVEEARALVTGALTEICRFQRAEGFLMAQVGRGIGDISTSEKKARTTGAAPRPPVWPATPLGRVASAAWAGRLTVFAGALEPVLSAAARAVTEPPAGWAADNAALLSDLTFRAFLGDPYCPVGRQAAALTAYWFERGLKLLAGGWIGDLHSAELSLAAVRRRGTDPRAEASAQVAVLRSLLEAGTLHARAGREGARAVGALCELTGWDTAAGRPGGTRPGEHTDLRALCDAATRHGIALLRFGDLRGARAAYELAASVTEGGLAAFDKKEARSYELRARHNIADVLIAEGRPRQALSVIDETYTDRRAAAAASASAPVPASIPASIPASVPAPREGDAHWRRVTLSAEVRVRALSRAGRVVEAVVAAEEIVADRRDRLGGVDNVSTAGARVSLAEALLAAGHPAEARHHVEDARQYRRGRLVATGYWPQYDKVLLARVHLALGDPGAAVDTLEGAVVTGEWFAGAVSFRLSLAARRALALARAALDGPEEAMTALRALCDLIPGPASPADPLALALRRDVSELLLATGDGASAMRLLREVRGAEHASADDPPGQARTLMLEARAAELLGVPAPGVRAAHGLDPTHLVLLQYAYDEAARAGSRDPGPAGELLAPLLCRTSLAHGRPALGDGHPLHARARALADQIGLPRPPDPHVSEWEHY